jgi:hypothetical protein
MTNSPQPQLRPRNDPFLPLLLLSALVLFCVHLWRGLAVDEYTSWEVTGRGVGDLVRNRLRAGHFPAYFLLLKAWRSWAGDSEFALRLPSVLMTLAAVWVLARLAEDLFDRETARLAALFCVLHQLTVWTAQTARPYAGVFLFGVLMAWGLTRWWKTGRLRWLWLVFFASGLGFSFLAAFAMTVFSLAVACVWSARKGSHRRAWWGLAAMVTPVVLQSVLLWRLAESQKNYGAVEARLRLRQAFNAVGHVFLGDYSLWTKNWFLYLAWAFAIACGVGAWRFHRVSSAGPADAEENRDRANSLDASFARFRASAVWCWAWTSLPLLFLTDSLFARKSVLAHERYFVPALGGLLLFLSVGVRYWMRLPWFQRRAWLPIALTLAALASCTLGWLAQGDDGPKTVSGEMRRIHPPRIIAGNVAGFEYEFRGDREVRFVDLTGISADEAEEKLSAAKPAGPVWLTVYNNKKDALDAFLKNPPRGFRVVECAGSHASDTRPVRLEAGNARAVLLEPIVP